MAETQQGKVSFEILEECAMCGGSGSIWLGSGTDTVEPQGAIQACACCHGSGRVIDLDATMQAIIERGGDG